MAKIKDDKKEDKKKESTEFKDYEELQQGQRSIADLDKQQDFITTGSLIFDIFLGGGYSPGISRFMGEPEHGKTLQSLTWAKFWLNHYGDKGKVYYFDTEGRLTYRKLKLAGIPNIKNVEERFIIVRNNVFDDIADFIRDKIKSNDKDEHYFFVFDSLDMLITKDNLKKGFSDAEKVGAAQVMSTLMMKHIGVFFADKGHHLQILSQIRANINTNNPNSPKTKMSGANALRHGSDLTAEIQKNFGGQEGMFIFENPNGATVKDKGNIVGHYFTLKFTKTMNEKTGQTIRIPIKRGLGIWREREVVDLAIAFGQIRKRGAWYMVKDDKDGWANTDWIDRINKDITAKQRDKHVEEAVAKALKESSEAGTQLSKAAIRELTESSSKAAESIKFEIQESWQGYEKLFSYIEKTPDLVDWLDKEFRTHLLSDSVVVEVGESDLFE